MFVKFMGLKGKISTIFSLKFYLFKKFIKL